jgi:hypothetical protein
MAEQAEMIKPTFDTLTEALNYHQKREDNQWINEIREQKLCNEINKHCTHRKKNPKQKCTCDDKLKQLLDKYETEDIIIVKCTRKGGMGASYDFVFEMSDGSTRNVELKVFDKSNKIPQLTDVYIKTRDELIENQFNSFIDTWEPVLKELKIEFKIDVALPSTEELMKNICKPGKSSCGFLEELKKNIKSNPNNNKKLNEASKKHIDKFLEENFKKISQANIINLYKQKLNCKDLIIIYNKKTGNFTLKYPKPFELSIDDVKLQKCRNNEYNIGLKVDFKVDFKDEIKDETKKKSDVKNIHSAIIRLRWKNRNGVYGPSFKLDPLKI